MKNMVVQCIHAGSHGKRQEVVRLIARILEVAPEELDPVRCIVCHQCSVLFVTF